MEKQAQTTPEADNNSPSPGSPAEINQSPVVKKAVVVENPADYAIPQNIATQDNVVVVEVRTPPKPRFRRLKRAAFAIFAPLAIALVGILLFAAVGDSAVISTSQWIGRVWWPATLFRIAIYAVLSWIVTPLMMQQVREQALQRLADSRGQLFEDGAAEHDALQEIEALEARAQAANIRPLHAFAFFVCVDIFLIQLPYFI